MDFRTASELCKNKILTKEGRSWAEYYPIEIEPEKCWGSWLSYLLSTLSTIWAKLRVPLVAKSSVYNWFVTQRYARDDLSSQSQFSPHFRHFGIFMWPFCFVILWKLKMTGRRSVKILWKMMINPEVMMILLIISQEFGLLEVDNSSTSHSKEWKLFYVNEIKKITKRIILKIFPRNFRLLLRCRL